MLDNNKILHQDKHPLDNLNIKILMLFLQPNQEPQDSQIKLTLVYQEAKLHHNHTLKHNKTNLDSQGNLLQVNILLKRFNLLNLHTHKMLIMLINLLKIQLSDKSIKMIQMPNHKPSLPLNLQHNLRTHNMLTNLLSQDKLQDNNQCTQLLLNQLEVESLRTSPL